MGKESRTVRERFRKWTYVILYEYQRHLHICLDNCSWHAVRIGCNFGSCQGSFDGLTQVEFAYSNPVTLFTSASLPHDWKAIRAYQDTVPLLLLK